MNIRYVCTHTYISVSLLFSLTLVHIDSCITASVTNPGKYCTALQSGYPIQLSMNLTRRGENVVQFSL